MTDCSLKSCMCVMDWAYKATVHYDTICFQLASTLTSYPVLLAPAFVACSTDAGKAWYVTCNDVPVSSLEEWHIPRKPPVSWHSDDCNHWPCSSRAVHIRQFWWVHKAAPQECATSPNIHPTSRHITASDEFFQALSYVNVSTASDKCGGEKAWVWG